MATAKHFNENGEGASDVKLREDLFDAPINEQVLYEVVKSYLAHQRQGTAKTKERGEISHSNAKLFRQKGTGRARSGSLRSPLREGGGTIFGPKPHKYRTRITPSLRRTALKSALSDRASLGEIYVVENPNLDAPKTKAAVSLLGNMGLTGRKVLFVTADEDPVLYRSLRNVKGVDVTRASQLNA